MIARLPGRIPAGSVNPVPSYFADRFPALGDVAGPAAPGGLDGESLWPLLTGRARAGTVRAHDLGVPGPLPR